MNAKEVEDLVLSHTYDLLFKTSKRRSIVPEKQSGGDLIGSVTCRQPQYNAQQPPGRQLPVRKLPTQ